METITKRTLLISKLLCGTLTCYSSISDIPIFSKVISMDVENPVLNISNYYGISEEHAENILEIILCIALEYQIEEHMFHHILGMLDDYYNVNESDALGFLDTGDFEELVFRVREMLFDYMSPPGVMESILIIGWEDNHRTVYLGVFET